MPYTVRIQVIKVYDVRIEADSEQEALDKAERMQTLDIAEKGSLQDAMTDYAEVIRRAG